MIWGKSNNKIFKNAQPETPDELYTANLISLIGKSSDMRIFMKAVKNHAQLMNPYLFGARIKSVNSAIRKSRISGCNDKNLCDICGFLIITNNEEHNRNVVHEMQKLFPEREDRDLTNEFTAREIAPLCHTILVKKYIPDIGQSVPIEIRIQEKAKFLATQAVYYPIFKNDTLEPSLKYQMLDILVKHMYNRAKLDYSELTPEERLNTAEAVRYAEISYSELFKKHSDIVYDVWKEYARVSFQLDNNRELERLGNEIPYFMDKVNDIIEKRYDICHYLLRDDNATELEKHSKIYNDIKHLKLSGMSNMMPRVRINAENLASNQNIKKQCCANFRAKTPRSHQAFAH